MSSRTDEREFEDFMSKYGKIVKCAIVYDQKTGKSRGFGFITYADKEDAVYARKEVNGKELDGREVRVDFSITRKAHSPTPGHYMGRETYRRSRSRDRYSRRSRSRDRRRRSRSRSYDRRRSSRDRYDSRSSRRGYERDPRDDGYRSSRRSASPRRR